MDRVAVDRHTARWVLERAFSSGNAWSLVALRLADTPARAWREPIVLTGRAAVRLARGTLRAAVGVLIRHHAHQAKGLRTAARGLGMLLGAYTGTCTASTDVT